MTTDIPSTELLEEIREAAATAELITKLQEGGHTVHCDKAGGFVVTRWSLSRHCIDSLSLHDFAKQVGVL
jgi:hypothetical protein